MTEYRNFDFLKILLTVIRLKNKLLLVAIITVVLSYMGIYFLIPPSFDSEAIILSVDESKFNPIGSLNKSISNIPLSVLKLGSQSSSENYDLFTTLIYSRPILDSLIERFDLMNDYNLESLGETRKTLKKNINVDITDERAYSITIRASTPQKAFEMTTHLLDLLNEKAIELNVKKSRDYRIFLSERYDEIKINLANAEDSLKLFQKSTGFYDAENQMKATLDAYIQLETQLAVKEIEFNVLDKIYGHTSPQTVNAEISINEFKTKLGKIKTGDDENKLIFPIDKLPGDGLRFIRYYRDVQIFTAMLEFIIPLYEQAKFEEVKNTPVIQVIDSPLLPEKKSYPPRTIFSLLITIGVLGFFIFFVVVSDVMHASQNPYIVKIKEELFHFKKK